MSWVAVGTVVVGAVVADQQNDANKDALNAQQRAGDASIGEQRRQFDLTRQDMQPWLETGRWGLDQQRAYLEGDTSGFENSADYRVAVDQGFKGLERGLAANLGGASGGADADRIALGQGLASQYGNNYFAKISGLSGGGYQAANALGGYGQNFANAFGQNQQNMANARQRY